jgi:hypothetical protein
MSELNDDQLARLSADVNNGQIIRGFCQHPGFKLYQEALMAIIEDKKQAWLKGNDEDAKLERLRAQGVQKGLDILKQFILLGQNSARILNNDVPNLTDK